MLTRELNTIPLSEAPLAPGEQRDIDLKIGDYLAKIEQADKYERSLKRFADEYTHPEAVVDKVREIKAKYQAAVDKLRDEAKPHGARLDKVIQNIKKNCKEAIGIYQAAGRMWSVSVPTTELDMFYAKTPVHEVSPVLALVDDMLVKGYKAKALFSNGIVFNRIPKDYDPDTGVRLTVFDVYPVNGTQYTKLDSSLMDNINAGVENIFDRRKIEELYRVLNPGLDNDTNWREFRERANIDYGSVYDVGYGGGFMDHRWEQHLEIVKQMVGEGKFPQSVLPQLAITNFITKDSFDRRFDISVGPPKGHLQDTLAKGAYFAVNRKFANYMYKALEIRKDYW